MTKPEGLTHQDQGGLNTQDRASERKKKAGTDLW